MKPVERIGSPSFCIEYVEAYKGSNIQKAIKCMARRVSSRCYSRGMLLALSIGYVINLLLVIVPPALSGGINATGTMHGRLNALVSTGFLLFIAEAIFVLIYDWHGAITLRGWGESQISRARLTANVQALYLILYFFLPEIMLVIYLFRIVRNWRPAKEQKRFAMKKRIALMEAQLGILPPTGGTCRVCGKRLQLGAEFCQYCREPVIERPKICPSCAQTTMPDAQWCPQCGMHLAA
jgi:hypothetical protein